MNNDFNPNDLNIDTGGVVKNRNNGLGILNARQERANILESTKSGLLDSGRDIERMVDSTKSLTSSLEQLKSVMGSNSDLSKQYNALLSILKTIKKTQEEINMTYEDGNTTAKEAVELNVKAKEEMIKLQGILDNITDSYNDQTKELYEQAEIEDRISRNRTRRELQQKKELKGLENYRKEYNKLEKDARKSQVEAWKNDVKKLRSFITDVGNALNIDKLAKNSEMSSAQKLQTQIQQMYGFSRKDFQQWKTSGKSGVDTAVYSSDDFKKAIEVIPDLNLSAQKAADLMPTLVRGQKLLGMTAEEQKQLAILSNRNGKDMLTYTTNRIAQYMKNDEKLNIKQLNEMISLNAALSTRAADYGIDSLEFNESLNNATKALTDVFGQESGKDNVYRSAMESIMTNFDSAALAYGMSEGQLREYLNGGGTLFDLNKNSSGAANYLYNQLMTNYEGTMNDWQKYSSIVGDQNVANLIKSQVDAQRSHGVDLSSQTKANAATARSADALDSMEKDYKDNMSITQKFFSKASNWIDDQFDWVTQENFYRDVVALLTVIEATLAAGQAVGNIIDLVKTFKGGGGSGLGGKLLGSASSGTGAIGLLSKVGAGATFLPGGSGVAAGTTGSALAGAGILAAGALGVGMMGYDAYKGYKEGGLGTAARYAFGGTATKESSNSDKLKAGLGNGLKGAAIGAAIGSVIPGVGTLVGGLVGAGIGLIGAGISQSFAKSDKVREKQLEEQKRIAKNTASSAASMEALRQSQRLTGNSYESYVPRKATMTDSELELSKNTVYGPGPDEIPDSSKSFHFSINDNGTIGRPIMQSSHFSKLPRNAGGFSISDGDRGSKIQASTNKGSGYPWNVTSGYGWRDGVWHGGVDFGIPLGTKIGAAKAGTVIETGWDSGGGGWHTAIKTDDGLRYSYLHQIEDPATSIGLKTGKRVKKGDLIGYSGTSGMSTGPHLHFQVDKGYSSWNNGLWMFDTDTPFKYITDGLFSASGASYDGDGSEYDDSSSSKSSNSISKNINDILTSTYKVNLSKAYGGTFGGTSNGKGSSLSDVVSGLSEIKQTLINLSDRQTQDEKIMNMISRQSRQDPRMS